MLIWQAHKGKIESAAFSPDGQLLATATGGAHFPYLWEPNTGKLLRKLAGASGPVKSVAFAPHVPLLAAGTDASVCVWNTETWDVIAELRFEHAFEIAFGRGEKPLIAVSSASLARLWRYTGTDQGEARFTDGWATSVAGVAALHFSPDSALLATSTKSTAELWHAVKYERARTLRTNKTNNRGAVRFAPDGERVALAHGKWVEVWPVAEEPGPLVKFAAGTGRSPIVWAVNWTADGRSLLTAGNDGFVRVWAADTGTERKAFDWKIGKLYCAAFSPDGLTCAACSDKGKVVVWDVDE